MTQSNEIKTTPYPLPVHGVIKMSIVQTLPFILMGLSFLASAFLFSLWWNLIPIILGLFFLIIGCSMTFTDANSFTVTEAYFERKTCFKTQRFPWAEIAEVKMYDLGIIKRIDLMGAKKPSLCRQILNPGAPVSSVPVNYVKNIDAERLVMTIQQILSERATLGKEELTQDEEPLKTEVKPVKVRFLPVLVGCLILAGGGFAFIIAGREIFDFDFETTLMLLAFIIQPLLSFIIGIILGLWVGHWPSFEIGMIVVISFIRNIDKLIRGEIDASGWGWGWLGLIISIAVVSGCLAGGASVGRRLKKPDRFGRSDAEM
ncbi:MAG: hypothetical protein GXY86_09530 [Firmicutes bacterium]|nr:hypothetical protein [Bacillota bacterium]